MGTQSKIQLYNEALLLIGANEVSSTTETTPNATLCNRFFESARDFVTVDTRWNSAQSEATLTADSTKPTINELWSDRSLLPADPYCLRVLMLMGQAFLLIMKLLVGIFLVTIYLVTLGIFPVFLNFRPSPRDYSNQFQYTLPIR